MNFNMLKRILTLILLVSITPYCLAVEKIIVNGLFKNKAIVTIDGKQRILNIGKTSPEGVKLISANSKEAVLEIDGEQKIYKLGSHIGGAFKKAPEGVTVTITPDARGSYYVNGSINDFQVRFLVDTGATLIFMNKHVAKRIGLNYRLEGQEGTATTASGLTKMYVMNLKKVKVGNIELRDIVGAVSDGDFPNDILLGTSFLNKIDSHKEGRILKLEKN